MKQNICISVHENNETHVLYEGEVEMEERYFSYRENESGIFTEIQFYADGLDIKRHGREVTNLTLRPHESRLHIISAEGELTLPDVKLLAFHHDEHGAYIAYQVAEMRWMTIQYKERVCQQNEH